MKKTHFVLIAALFTFFLLLSGCSEAPNTEDFTGQTYVYEKDGAGGQFTITINEDGTFSYYEGFLSSYIGLGDWSIENNMIRLADRELQDSPSIVNYFKFENEKLVFVKRNSTNFTYVEVKNGDTFKKVTIPAVTTSPTE